MHSRRRTSRRPRRRWIDRFLLTLLVGLVGLGVAAVLSGRYQVRPVLSGSMRPGLPVGGVVITQRVPITALHVRDVVVFHRPDQPQELVVHRIISMAPSAAGPIVRTQGDANDTPDPWQVNLHGTTAYRAVFSVPFFGYAALWAHSPFGREMFLLAGVLLVVGAGASSLVARRGRARRTPQRTGRRPDTVAAPVVEGGGDPVPLFEPLRQR